MVMEIILDQCSRRTHNGCLNSFYHGHTPQPHSPVEKTIRSHTWTQARQGSKSNDPDFQTDWLDPDRAAIKACSMAPIWSRSSRGDMPQAWNTAL